MKVSTLLAGGGGCETSCLPYLALLAPAPSIFPSSPCGVFLRNLGEDMLPASQNPDPISDQKFSLSTHVFRPGLQKPDPFSDHK